MSFPKDFVWGAAAASYQVEGAATEDGRGDSVWDMMCRKPGAIWSGQNGAVACDHYHRYEEDVTVMRELGLKAYRFSISWPRVLPAGTGAVNARGLDFYDRLVDALLVAGIAPWATLFHWDFPTALYQRGGWLNRASADWFADYTRVVVDKLSDRVTHWMTLNEPQCFIGLGLVAGTHAPGDKLELRQALLAGHHAMLAHGRAVQVIRAQARSKPQIGYAPVAAPFYPETESAADVAAARTAAFQVKDRGYWNSTWWMDPVYLGKYPEDGLQVYGADAPKPAAGDLETMRQPLDFFGANMYSGTCIRAATDGSPQVVPPPVGHALTAFRWTVTPEILRWMPRFCHERYGLPIVITENGMSGADWVALDGAVHDPQRIDFLQRYLRELQKACADGVPVQGYFQWSIMDNFEWAEGYKERFGLVFVDYPTGRRIPKDSAWWYRDVIASNGATL